MELKDYSFPVGQDVAFKFGCGRFRMEEHLLERCASEILRFGRRPLFVGNALSHALAYDRIAGSLKAEGVGLAALTHEGYCNREAALELARKGALDGADVILGCGGGVAIDFSKCLADIAGVPIVTVPTSSATCCAYTPIAVCYTADAGAYVSTTFFRREIAATLLDLTILSRQPSRLLVAGACDAMAKKIEIEFWNAPPDGAVNPVTSGLASAASDFIYAELDRKTDAAAADLAQGEPTPAIRDVIFASVVGAGFVSGISGGARQTALAHGFYFFVRSRYPGAGRKFTHGELVAVGLVLQLAYNGRAEAAEAFAARLRRWGLAASMGDLGLAAGPADFEACVAYLCAMDEMKWAGPAAVPRLRAALASVFR